MFESLVTKFSGLFSGFRSSEILGESAVASSLELVREALFEADVPEQVVAAFVTKVKERVVGTRVPPRVKPSEYLAHIVFEECRAFLGGDFEKISFNGPMTVMVMGLQGSGKTTSAAKIAKFAISKGITPGKIMLASVDFKRPAAQEQLRVLATSLKVGFCKSRSTSVADAVEEIYDAFSIGRFELLILDTAGRLIIDDEMIIELRLAEARIAPRYKILVLDAMTGQQSLDAARAFEQGVGFSHVFLSKMDSSARVGALFSIRYVLKRPIQFVGTGEGVEDIEIFHPDRVAHRMLGKGDLETLAEKADAALKRDGMKKPDISLSGMLSLRDFLDQLQLLSSVGSFSTLVKYLPAGMVPRLGQEELERGERSLKRMKAICSSMTEHELLNPILIDGSRKKRIAKGAGVKQADVDELLSKWAESNRYMKLLKKSGGFGNIFR